MRHLNPAVMGGVLLLAAALTGCASGPSFHQSAEESKSAIRAAEVAGSMESPTAGYHLHLAKEQLARAEVLAAAGDKKRAASMLTRAEADAELAIALSHEQDGKADAAEAIERVRKLREENRLPRLSIE
jgi:hypothetical protein